MKELHKIWNESGANKDSFQAFIYFLPNYLDTLRDEGLKHGLLSLTVYHALLDSQDQPPEVVEQLYKYFRYHVHGFIKSEINAKQQSNPGRSVENVLQSSPMIRDIQMFVEFYGMCLGYFPLVRTEIPEAHNKYIKKEMMQGLVRQASAHAGLINEKSKYFIDMLFSGLHFGLDVDLNSRDKLLIMIKRECANLAGELFDPALLDLEQSIRKYGKCFQSLFVQTKCDCFAPKFQEIPILILINRLTFCMTYQAKMFHICGRHQLETSTKVIQNGTKN